MNSKFGLGGERALITGGATGIGYGIAKEMVAAGAEVVLVGRRESALREAAESLGERAFTATHDVTDVNGAEALIAGVTERFGPITILVNNAGNHVKKLADDISMEEFRWVLDTHLTGAFALTRAVIPAMKRARKGSILFTASMATFIGVPQVVAYSAAKAAYGGLVRSLAVELGEYGVRVNAIAPGWIRTPMLEKTVDIDPARRDRVLTRTPMRRFGEVAEIGTAAVFLAGAAASFITGTILPVDGGILIGF